jgi:hypothetical protein
MGDDGGWGGRQGLVVRPSTTRLRAPLRTSEPQRSFALSEVEGRLAPLRPPTTPFARSGLPLHRLAETGRSKGSACLSPSPC